VREDVSEPGGIAEVLAVAGMPRNQISKVIAEYREMGERQRSRKAVVVVPCEFCGCARRHRVECPVVSGW
jgi:hypothetical protein